jgi:hypothetical protein
MSKLDENKLEDLVYGADGDFDRKRLFSELRAYIEERFGPVMHDGGLASQRLHNLEPWDARQLSILRAALTEAGENLSKALARAKEE